MNIPYENFERETYFDLKAITPKLFSYKRLRFEFFTCGRDEIADDFYKNPVLQSNTFTSPEVDYVYEVKGVMKFNFFPDNNIIKNLVKFDTIPVCMDERVVGVGKVAFPFIYEKSPYLPFRCLFWKKVLTSETIKAIEENRIYLENFEFRTKTHPENSFEIYNLIFSYDKKKEEKEETYYD